MENMNLWEKVATPNPKYTKEFNRGGGFKGTATNTQYVVMRATEIWGPNGTGWGVEISQEQYVNGAPIIIDNVPVGSEIIHVIRGSVWYIDAEGVKRNTSEQYGQTTFVGKNKYGVFTDEEAPKKSVTDMMLKCFSLLGFSADIFLGLWDDNKYVNDVRKRFEEKKPEKPPEPPKNEKKKLLSADWEKAFDAECEKTLPAIKIWRLKHGKDILNTIANDQEKMKLKAFLDENEAEYTMKKCPETETDVTAASCAGKPCKAGCPAYGG